MTHKKYGINFKYLPAERLAQVLLTLPEGAVVSTNQVGNLGVYKFDGKETFDQIAWIDFVHEGTVEEF